MEISGRRWRWEWEVSEGSLRGPEASRIAFLLRPDPVLFIDGTKYVADRAGAYWFSDGIAIIQPHRALIVADKFQVLRLVVNADQIG
jgi:hypothetical protein